VYIGDASPQPSFVKLKNKLQPLQNSSIHVYNYPDESTYGTLFLLNSRMPKTIKWVVCTGDDDFLLIDGLSQLIEKIARMPKEFTSIRGRSFTFALQDEYGSRIVRYGQYLTDKSRLEESSNLRMLNHSRNYYPGFFSIRPRELFEYQFSFFKELLGNNFAHWAELVESFFIISSGKAIYYDVPYLFREVHSGRKTAIQVGGYDPDTVEFDLGRKYFIKNLYKMLGVSHKDNKVESSTVEEILSNLRIGFVKPSNQGIKKWRFSSRGAKLEKLVYFIIKDREMRLTVKNFEKVLNKL
jgi:hypothetical protein